MAWRQPRYDNQRQANNFAGGLNNGSPAFNLADDEASAMFGFNTDDNPALTVRGGRTAYGATGSAQTNLLANFGQTHLVRAVGTALQYWNGSAWTAIAGTFTNADWDSTNFNDTLIMTNGTDAVQSWNGSALSGLDANAPKGKYITNDTVRVWIAKGDILYYSAFLDETDWLTAENSGSAQYYTPNGGDITGIKNFANHICVFKKDSFAEIFGTDYYSFRLIENSNDIGCVSHKTIVEVGDTLFWLGMTDVYAYKGGYPVKIGQKVRSYLDAINQTHIAKCWGGTDGVRYYLGLVTGANTEPDTVLVFDPRYGTWLVHSITGSTFRYATYFNGAFYIGDSAGLVHTMNSGTTDGGTAIAWSVTSKAFNEGFPEAEKEYYELHIQAYLPSGSTMVVSVSTDDDSATFTAVQTVTASTDTQNINIIVPLDTVPIANWFRYKISGTGPATIYEVQRYFRVEPVQM